MKRVSTSIAICLAAACAFASNGVNAQTKAMPTAKPAATYPTGLPSGFDCNALRERGVNPGSPIVAKPLPHDSRLVIFPYDKNALYPVNTVFNRFTHFEFEQGETIVASYVNDESEWEQKVSGTRSDILIRPKIRGAVGSMTTITDRRRYQIDLLDVSGCPNENRYQRVSWQVNDQGMYEDRDALGRMGRGNYSASMAGGLGVVSGLLNTAEVDIQPEKPPMVVNLEGLNARYEWDGDKDLSPEAVLDDGKRTWIKFPANLALRPALFAVSPEGQGETVEYIPSGAYFIVSKVFSHGILLKLGKREVRIRNLASSCGWFDTRCRKVAPTNMGGQ